jgi:hypothetical protein
MGKLTALIEQLKTFTPEKQSADVSKIVVTHEDDIVELNQSQMLLGETATGGIIGRYSNPIYEAFKESLNPKAGGNVDLKLTGGFQGNMFLKGTSFPFTTDTLDEKRSKLIDGDGYGKEVFGLNEPNKEKLTKEILKEDIQDYYRSMFKV